MQKNVYTVYVTKKTLELIQHFYSHYTDNDERLRSSYNAEDSLKVPIERLNKYYEFSAAASDTLSQTQLVFVAYRLVAKTVQYPEDCRVWRMQDKKSWTGFRTTSSRLNPTSESGSRNRTRVATEPKTWS